MIIVGLDLSLTGSGVAVLDTASRGWIVALERSRPEARIPTPGRSPRARTVDKGISAVWDRGNRIAALADRILALLPQRIDLAVIEGPSHASTGGQPHERGGLWWAVATDLLRRGVPLAEVAPRQRALYATGRGDAAKASVVADSVPRYELGTRNDNIVDAVLLAAMGARALGEPVDDLTEPHTLALRHVAWPHSHRKADR